MTEPWDLECDHFATGAVGEPGQRTFFLQGAEGKRVVTLKCEKQQVGALAEYLSRILADLPGGPPEGAESPNLKVPLEPAFAVGTLALGYDEAEDRLVLQLQELVADEDDPQMAARWSVNRTLAAGFVKRADELMAGGRPSCALCGRPIDPEGHTCVKTNGHLPH